MRDGAFLVDEKGRRAGKVMETIGSVSSPYLSVQPGTDRIERIVGTKLFMSETLPRQSDGGRQFRSNKKNKPHGFQRRGRRNVGDPRKRTY